MFDRNAVLCELESLRRPNGAFIAAPTQDYSAMWIRDHLYATFAYWYLNEYEKLTQGVWVVFDLLKRYKEKIRTRRTLFREAPQGILHAKFDADTLNEVTADNAWGHHQLDALGLFLHIVADLDFKHIRIIRDEADLEIVQLVVRYLHAVEYWKQPDNGMWEDCWITHSSSIGAVVGGLGYIKKRRLAEFDDSLIEKGQQALDAILPFESRDRTETCAKRNHGHDCDAAQLSLIWPYNVIVNPQKADEILSRIVDGHATEDGNHHRLLQQHGINRYWGDEYYRSGTGVSGEWPMFKFWVSIIYSQRHEYERALQWFQDGCTSITDNRIPEAYQNGKPNNHTPLAWAHAIALIAFSKLSPELQAKVQK